MKKVLFFIAIVVLASCNSNEEASNIKEQFQEEFLNRNSNEDYNDDQLGYFKFIDFNSIEGGNYDKKIVATTWVTYGEYKEMRSNPDYLFYARKTKGSTEENPVLVSAKYNGAGGGHGPFELDDDDHDPIDLDTSCIGAINLNGSSRAKCTQLIAEYRASMYAEAARTCEKYGFTKNVCCFGKSYGIIYGYPPKPCYPDNNDEPGKVVTGKWIAYTPEVIHN